MKKSKRSIASFLARYKTDRALVKNILACYHRAEPDQRDIWLGWYETAFKWCRKIGEEHNTSPSNVAAIVALLSPKTSWKSNKTMTKKAIVAYQAGKCITDWGIFASMKTRFVIFELFENGTKPKLGQKTNSFFNNLCLDPEYVTIDRHATNIALDRVFGTLESLTPKSYSRIAKAYQKAANILGIFPAQVQSVTWCQQRKEIGFNALGE